MINSSAINSKAINGSSAATTGGATYSETISESFTYASGYLNGATRNETLLPVINLLDSDPLGTYQRSWADDITIHQDVTDQFISIINEVLATSSTLSSSSNRSMTVNDLFTINDKLLITLVGIVSENITLVHSYTDLFKLIGVLSEVIHTSDASISTADLKILVASAFTLNALLTYSNHAEVLLEAITITEDYLQIYNAAEALVELITVDDLPVNHVRLTVISDDIYSMSDDTATKASFFTTLAEDVVFLISFDDGTTTYQGFTMNPETYAVTTYDNYPFNSTTNYDGSYLLANTSGLYSMEGDTDEGTYITSKVKTAALDFGSSSLKQCPKVYLGINNDASLILRVSIDGAYTSTYQLDIASDDLSTQIFDIGKGLKGRYWQFDLQTKNNSSFELDEIELFPIQWGRKQR